jgi:hypothetical protein
MVKLGVNNYRRVIINKIVDEGFKGVRVSVKFLATIDQVRLML